MLVDNHKTLCQLDERGFSTWKDSDSPPAATLVEHIYFGDKFLQNTDGTNYGDQWRWVQPDSSGALRGGNIKTWSKRIWNPGLPCLPIAGDSPTRS